MHKDGKQRETRPTTTVTMSARRRCKYCSQAHKLRQCPAYGKKCDISGKLNHFQGVCRSSKSNMVHTLEKEAEMEQEPGIKTVNINSVRCNSNHSAILANLKTSSNKVIIMVSYKVDTGSDGNILPFHIYKKLFHNTTVNQLAATKDAKSKLKT